MVVIAMAITNSLLITWKQFLTWLQEINALAGLVRRCLSLLGCPAYKGHAPKSRQQVPSYEEQRTNQRRVHAKHTNA